MLGLPQSVCLELSASEQGSAACGHSGHTPPTAPRDTILRGCRVDVAPAAGLCDSCLSSLLFCLLSVSQPLLSPAGYPPAPQINGIHLGTLHRRPQNALPPCVPPSPAALDTQLPGSGQKLQEAVRGPTRLLPSMGRGSRAGGCACAALSEEGRSPGPLQPTVCVFSFHRTAPSSIRRTSSSKCGSCSPPWGQGWGRPPWR